MNYYKGLGKKKSRISELACIQHFGRARQILSANYYTFLEKKYNQKIPVY